MTTISDVLYTTGDFNGCGKTALFYQQWVPKAAKSSVLIIHGIGEHSSRYTHVALYLASRSYAVYAFDLPGHGRSEGPRGHIERFDDYPSCVDLFLKHLHLPGKVFLLGHSLGGLIALDCAMRFQDRFCGVIASAPAIGLAIRIPPGIYVMARALDIALPSFALADTSIRAALLSHDSNVTAAYDNDPLVTRKRSARFIMELIRAQRRIRDNPGKLALPALFLKAGSDNIVSDDAIDRFFADAGSCKKSLIRYDDFFHEIFNETGKERPLKDMVDWLDKTV